MICFNRFWTNVWIISVVIVSIKCTPKLSFIDIIQDELEEKKEDWIDDKGLLKYPEEEPMPQKCESCTHLARVVTDGSEVCYIQDPGKTRYELTSICSWTENTSNENITMYSGSVRKFPIIEGLKVLSIMKYKIETWIDIDSTFSSLTDLEHLYLENNHITGWSASGEKPLEKLKVLSLANNPIAYLSKDSFIWLNGSNLQYLNMRGCSNVKILDSAVFSPLAYTKSMWLDLSYTILQPIQLANLTASFKNGRKNGLSVLSLAHTGLYRIPTEALENIAHSLQKLSLQGNYFSNCWRTSLDGNQSDEDDCLFPTNMDQLKEINLKDSGLSDFPFEIVLNATKNLKILYLDDNPLQEMSCSEASNISYISLRNIRKDKGMLICANENKCAFPALKILDLSNSWINMDSSNFSNLESLKYLSLYNSVRESVTNLLKPLTNLKFLDLSNNKLGTSLFNTSFTELPNLEVLIMQSSNVYISSTSFPFSGLPNLRILDLRNNFIQSLTETLLNGLQKLQKLILRGNRIRSWKEPVLKNVPHLQSLDLQNNWITDITSGMLTDFSKVEEIDISNNLISCGCQEAQFFETCKNKTLETANSEILGNCAIKGINITLLNWEELMLYECSRDDNYQTSLSKLDPRIVCTTTTMEPVTPSTTRNPNNLDSTTTGSTTTPVVSKQEGQDNDANEELSPKFYFLIPIAILPIVGGLFYWKRLNIIIYVRMFRRKMVLTMLKDNKPKKGKKDTYQYDVFLSYSDRDREWILQQLIPNIEQRGHIKVCLHERDFEAGLPVLENIIACMDSSRCVLLVLSEAFLRSHWCQFELNLAQHRLLEMQHDRLILVLLENIPRDKCSKMLRYLMLTKTYLVWPDKGSDEENSLFWRKLKKAIGPVQDTMTVSFA